MAAGTISVALTYASGNNVGGVLSMLFGGDREDRFEWLPESYMDAVSPQIVQYHYQTGMTLAEFEEQMDMSGGIMDMYSDRPSASSGTVPIDVELLDTMHRSGYTIKKYAMPSVFDSESVPFYELLPDDRDAGTQLGTVLVIPGSGNQGALDVLGEPGPYERWYYHDSIAQVLVDSGYAVYTTELRGYGERAVDAGSECDKHPDLRCSTIAFEAKLHALGLDMNDIRTDEITQVLAWVESREYTGKIAVAGLSLGALLAAGQAIINGDILEAVVLASGPVTALHSPVLDISNTVPVLPCCDTTDQIAAIAPIPLYVSFGLSDSVGMFRWEAQNGYSNRLLSDVYKLHGVPERFTYIKHEGGHEYRPESVLDFLRVNLAHA